MSVSYFDTPFGGALASSAAENGEYVDYRDYQVIGVITEFSFMPKELINRVVDFKVTNVEVTFENGESEKWGEFIYEPNTAYYPDEKYDFKFTKTLNETNKSIEEYYAITHIKADIVVNTTDETNKIIGHLDEDITPDHY